VFSFGPGKQIDAGEGGLVLTADAALHDRVMRFAAHPLRLELNGIGPARSLPSLGMRPHPLAAVLAAVQLNRWDSTARRLAHARRVGILRGQAGVRVLGADERRSNAREVVPVILDPAIAALEAGPSGAALVPGASPSVIRHSLGLLDRIRLVSVAAAHDVR
jgi:dTDP-4-amino-4,6-dideoxygalactose transaminase